MASPQNGVNFAKPELPAGQEGDPVLLVPTNIRVGFVKMPAVDPAHPEVPQEPLDAARLSLDTAVGTVHVALSMDYAGSLCKTLAKLLGLSEPSRIEVAGAHELAHLDDARRRRG